MPWSEFLDKVNSSHPLRCIHAVHSSSLASEVSMHPLLFLTAAFPRFELYLLPYGSSLLPSPQVFFTKLTNICVSWFSASRNTPARRLAAHQCCSRRPKTSGTDIFWLTNRKRSYSDLDIIFECPDTFRILNTSSDTSFAYWISILIII